MTKLDLSHSESDTNIAMITVRAEVNRLINPMARFASENGIVKKHDSFGWAIANPKYHGYYTKVWNEPKELIWMTGGSGKMQAGYSANAVCKIRPAARLNMDTAFLKENHHSEFSDVVETQNNIHLDYLEWGDFPHGGAVYVEVCGIRWLVAVSSLKADEDGIFAAMVATAAAQALHRANQLHLIRV